MQNFADINKVIFGGRSSVNKRSYTTSHLKSNSINLPRNANNTDVFGSEKQSAKSGKIVYNEFSTTGEVYSSKTISLKLTAILASVLICLLVVVTTSVLIYGTHNNQTATDINYGSLNNEFSSQSLSVSSNLKLINQFKSLILQNSLSKKYSITSPLHLTNYTTVSKNLWSVNIDKNGSFYWIQIAILTKNGCIYFLSNHSPSSVFGAGSGNWYSTVNQNIVGCSSSVTPDPTNWSGWQNF